MELGCSHGGFVALMRQAGYDASGVEMSPAIVTYGQNTFGVPIQLGPVECLDLPAGCLDLIVMMDVLEHLPDPAGTLAHCARLLAQDGVLLIQTPEYMHGLSYGRLQQGHSRFLEMMIPQEHLYLYSRASVSKLLELVGLSHTAFEQAIFDHYDMFLVASRSHLEKLTQDAVEAILLSTPKGRLTLAMLDLRSNALKLTQRLCESEADRAARLECMQTLEKQLLETRQQLERSGYRQWLVRKIKKRFFKRTRIAIDLIPLRPGGENGGAKTMVTTLLRAFAADAACPFEFLLIAAPWNEDELRQFDADNVSTQTQAWLYRPIWSDLLLHRWLPRIRQGLERRLQASPRRSLRRWGFGRAIHLNRLMQERFDDCRSRILQKRHRVKMLFCPFSAPTLAEPDLPMASVVYDLQHIDMPHLFSTQERIERSSFLTAASTTADRLLCISDFTRQCMQRAFNVATEKLMVIPICIHDRLSIPSPEAVAHELEKSGVRENGYFLYPANFWPHKNHKLLLTAYSIYCRQNETDTLDLVFTGALKKQEEALSWVVKQLDLQDKVHFQGYLPDDSLACVWQGCQALIFPSLYEGFGIPVLEAMRFEKPVACSRMGSLPEVGGDAVLYFDPRKPEDLACAMKQVGHDHALREKLVAAGRQRLNSFKPQFMIDQYHAVFRELTHIKAEGR